MRKIWIHGPALAMAAALFILSSISKLSAPDLGFDWQDKLYHTLAYALFGFLIQRSIFSWKGYRKSSWLLVLALGVGYGVFDEIHQYFVPGRNCHVLDMAADAAGICLSLILFFPYFKKRLR